MRLNTISSGRGGSVVLFVALLVALCPSDAFAVWGQNWGTMVWGAGAPSGATLPAWGLGLLALLLLGVSMRFLKRGTLKGGATGVAMFLVLSSLTAMAAFTVTHTFSNGSVASATQVNQNFTDIATELATKGGSLSVPNTFVNGTTADATAMNGNFTAVASAISTAGGSVSIPNTFSNGSTADATDVNANFAAVEAALDAMPPAGMVAIPAGTNAGTDPDFGAYSLTVSAFYMDKYPVTQTLWDEVKTWSDSNGYSYDNTGLGKAANHPVHTVNWYDVVKWCNARSEKAGLTPAYYTDAGYTTVFRTGTVSGVDPPYVNGSADGYRLPTDAEWEYAARGGAVSKRFPWGDSDNISHARANYRAVGGYAYDDSDGDDFHPTYNDAVFPYTSPVGDFAANGYGLYDMAGNVFEWCYSWYPGLEVPSRVFRGGSWAYTAGDGRVGVRPNDTPDYADSDIGFRAVLPPGP
jgi:formylglycine-generating enzyme